MLLCQSNNMVTLPGYSISEKIHDGVRTTVYRAYHPETQTPVVIKILNTEYPQFRDLILFRNQYAITSNLDHPNITKSYSIKKHRNSWALILEDFGGIALSKYINFQPLHLDEFFSIAIYITQALEFLYQNRIIHQDIKPQNILINPETKQVKLIDFSISSLLPKETAEIKNPNVLSGTLAYISPEQTGRMNRGIDYRTDFYSLGVTFYELLTGQLPFDTTNPLELVHCHLAKLPKSPSEVNPAISQTVSDIVMKLMAKTAESRYQTARGLRHDLEICQQMLFRQGQITAFELGKRDICVDAERLVVRHRFLIPEKLYGRETEVQTLLAAFDRVSSDCTEMMLVAGFSGIGKTAVVNEVHKPIVRQRGYFIAGKFDQFQRNTPFSALVHAFRNFMGQLLTESTSQLQEWKAKISEALGEQGRVIIDVIPELERIIDQQPLVAELTGNAAQNRFKLLFGKFIRVLATKEHPLVIFLDDLQWADSGSLKLIQLLMTETDIHYLLLIGAYRDNEVSPTHPLMLTLEEIRFEDTSINQITLKHLETPNLNRLVADTLSCPESRAMPLTELVMAKTKGNPFFTNQFLKYLYEDGLINFDFNHRYWQCDITQVRALSLTDNVVEFMALQLQKLPETTQNVLKLAACIGNQFDLATLAIVQEKSQSETAADLWRALQAGLILPITEVYKFYPSETVNAQLLYSPEQLAINNEQLTINYRFLHDRVQQAAYFLIPENHKKSTHLKIGQLLWSNTTSEELEENIFEIVNQLNIGAELIKEQVQRDKLVELNLIAGRKAKFYLAWGKEKIAQAYLNDAYYCYVRWGARAKVDDLEKRYPQLLSPILNQKNFSLNYSDSSTLMTNLTVSSNTGVSAILDLATVNKASLAISSEIQLDKLLQTLIKIILENVGAEKGSLILQQEGNTIIAAQCVNHQECKLQSILLNSSQEIPVSIINYVLHTREYLIVNDATAKTTFAADPYIIKHQPKSILCTPIVNQSKLIGILYLENNLTVGAFTPDRLEILKLLSSQAAISLENATLYAKLEDKVAERTQELNEKNVRLEQTLHELKLTQAQLIQTQKMSSLGQMVAGVAHEINNPVSFIYGNINHAKDYIQSLLNLIHVYQQEYPNPTPLIQKTTEDIDLDFLLEDLQKVLGSMQVGAERIHNIVLVLRNFSRLDEADMKSVDIHEGIESTLMLLQPRLREDAGYPRIEVIKEYGQLPPLRCYASQLNQVFINILNNAIDAIEESTVKRSQLRAGVPPPSPEGTPIPPVEQTGVQQSTVKRSQLRAGVPPPSPEGTPSPPVEQTGVQELNISTLDSGLWTLDSAQRQIRICTELTGDERVIISIKDNGSGMTEFVKARLFDPFFTTKPVGKGSGLGLSISYQIVVNKHGGKLKCVSEPGQGSEFFIEIPIQQQIREVV